MKPPGGPSEIPDSSRRWLVVWACFVQAVWMWGFGLYGVGIYLIELQKLHSWNIGHISSIVSLMYVMSGIIGIFVSDLIGYVRVKIIVFMSNLVLAASILTISSSSSFFGVSFGFLLMALAWVGAGGVLLSTVVGSWFVERRGLAVSLALCGASCGGVFVAPLLGHLVEQIGFARGMQISVVIFLITAMPGTWYLIDLKATRYGLNDPRDRRKQLQRSRSDLLKSPKFWFLSLASAFALMAQVGFIVHQMPIVREIAVTTDPTTAVVVTTGMALVGRLLVSLVADLWDPRRMFSISILVQAAALSVLSIATDGVTVMLACGLYGLSVGNTITFPVLIIQREYSPINVAVPLGLATAVVNVIGAFGPGALGWLRDLFGGYQSALIVCVVMECFAAGLILAKPRPNFYG